MLCPANHQVNSCIRGCNIREDFLIQKLNRVAVQMLDGLGEKQLQKLDKKRREQLFE
jgi:hypothetical protein